MPTVSTGQTRANARLAAKLNANAALYRDLPSLPISRQVARAKVRKAVKVAFSNARREALAGRRTRSRVSAVAS